MGNTCCQVPVDSNSFKDYCSNNASRDYRPYLTQLQNLELHVFGELNQKTEPIVLGNWAEGSAKTGQGIIYAPQRFYYEGPIAEGQAAGVGRIIWPNKIIFNGVVKDTKAEGQGEMYVSESKTELKGIWQNGYPKLNHTFELKTNENKKGTLTFLNKDREVSSEAYFKQQFIETEIDFESEINYNGQLKNKKGGFTIQGKGILKFIDGSYYQGDLIGGRMHGKGKYFWSKTGHWYQGQYKSNFREGYGKYFFKEGEFQEGQWNGGTLITIPKEEPAQIPHEDNKKEENEE